MNSEISSPQAEYFDRMLEEFGPEAVMAATIMGVAPTHVAKTNLAKRTREFGVNVKTVHSAFLTPNYPQAVSRALADLDAMVSPFAKVLARHIDGPEARFEECIETLGIIPEARIEEFREACVETKSAEAALAQVGVSLIELSDKWILNEARKEDPLLTIMDETSMVPASTVRAVAGVTTLVACGDGCQLPAVEKRKTSEDFESADEAKAATLNVMWNGLEAAGNISGAVKHEFTYNYRLQSEAPILQQTMDTLRGAMKATGGRVSSEVATAFTFIRQSKGGVRVVDELAADDAASIMRGENVCLAWMNVSRITLLDAARTSIALDNTKLVRGEPVIPSVRSRKNREAVAAAQGAELWHFAGDAFGRGLGNFEYTSTEEKRETIQVPYAFEYREDRAYMQLGLFRGCDVTLAFGYVRTVHKAQGRQWPRVYIFMPDVHKYHSMARMNGGYKDFVRWLYTAISRAETEVVFFHRWPSALPYNVIQDVRAQLERNVTLRLPEAKPGTRFSWT